VLVLPRDLRLFRRVLGVLAHVIVAERIPQAVVDYAVDHRLVAGLDPLPHPVDVVRRRRHRLLAAGEDALPVAGADRLRGQHHGAQAGTAHFVDGDRGDRRGDAAVDHRLARGRLAGAALHHLAHDDFVDRAGVDAGALDRLTDGDGPKLRRG